jgi:RES domain-containing protein
MPDRLPVRPWQGRVFRHIPADSPFGPLDSRFAARVTENRWNARGEPTLYFASDRGVLVGELARHFRGDRATELAVGLRPRTIFEIELRLERVFDLTTPEAASSLGIAGAPICFLDRTVARATAGFLRNVLDVEAMLAPSVVFLDDPTRWNLILFLDRLRTPLEDVAIRVEPGGTFRLTTDAETTPAAE